VQAVILGIIIAGGIAIYGLLLTLFGVVNWTEALGAIRQPPPGDLRI
jgi:putative peptidoglycan lipid II flippase